jgi:endoglucanase
MQRRELLELAERVLRLPTAPYHEQYVKDFVTKFCDELRGVRVEEDRVGNVIVKYERPQARHVRHHSKARAPIVFVAHMDHPGFEMLGGNRAEFLGGVPKEMFARGVGVRVYSNSWERPPGRDRVESRPGGRSHFVKAKIHRLVASAWPKRKLVTLNFEPGTVNPEPGTPGMWDVPAFRVVGNQLHAAAIDDVLGSVVMLATLAEVAQRSLRTHVWCVFTRAEEVGFQGARALICEKKIPKNAVVISIEMSKERPWARIGNGPVVRVGDRSTVFDPTTTAFLLRAAERCGKRQPAFRVQRCLMDGGSCEATAFAGFGYRAGGLCLPLGNYHNIGRNLRPRAEFVSISDLEQLLKLTVAAAGEWPGFGSTGAVLKRRLLKISQNAPRRLK